MATRLLRRRSYATLSALGSVARTKAETLSAHWKGTSATGGNTRNFIGGEFVESSTAEWHPVLDPVRFTLLPFSRLLITTVCTGHPDIAHLRPRNHAVRV